MSAAPFDYSRLVATAQRLITRFGRAITLTRATRTPTADETWITDPGPAATSAAQSVTVDAVFIGPDESQRPDQLASVKEGTVFIATSTALPEDPSIEWSVLDEDGVSYQITGLRAIKPGPTTILYRGEVQR